MTILYILLFIVCLSTLVMIHELGHLLTAKMFKVYCFEYAIGFGPKLISRKRKNGETYFSLRAIPFGGFVSMYGESETVPEGITVDPKRSLLAIAKWKRAIIMVAGVTMNAVLAIVIFFVYEIGFPKYYAHYAHISVASGSKAAEAGLNANDFVYSQRLSVEDKTLVFYDDSALVSYSDGTSVHAYIGYNYSEMTIKDASLYSHSVVYEKTYHGNIEELGTLDSLTFSQIASSSYVSGTNYLVKGYLVGLGKETKEDNSEIYFAVIEENFGENQNYLRVELTNFIDNQDDFKFVTIGSEISFGGTISQIEDTHVMKVSEKHYKVSAPILVRDLLRENIKDASPNKIDMSFYVVDESSPSGRGTSHQVNNIGVEGSDKTFYMENIGISMSLETRRNNYPEAVKSTFEDFGNAATLIGRSLASLFTDANSWKNVGGIIAIGVVTTRTLQESGFGAFLFYWAVISVNLAIMNLLPFPGLDGWHLLVIAIEGITRKEIPSKVKNYVSAIGVLLLLGLMVLIVIKDIVGLF